MPVLMSDRLHRLSVALNEHVGVRSEDARLIVEHQVASHLVGHDSHGVHLL